MNETLVLGIIIAVVWILVVYLRVPAVILFLSILIGKLFSEELTPDVFGFLKGIIPSLDPLFLQIGLLSLPVILTIVFLKGTTPKSKMIFNSVPLFFCLITLGLFINPYIDVVNRLVDQQSIILSDYQRYLVSLSGAVILLSAWLSKPSSHSKADKKHKK